MKISPIFVVLGLLAGSVPHLLAHGPGKSWFVVLAIGAALSLLALRVYGLFRLIVSGRASGAAFHMPRLPKSKDTDWE